MRGLGRKYQRGLRWWIAYYHHGKEYRESAGLEKKDAIDLLKTRLGEIAAGRFSGPARERLTVGDVLRAYVMHLEATGAKSLRQAKSAVRHLWKRFGDIRVVDLKPERLDRWIQACKAEGSEPGTIAHRAARL